MKSKGGKAHPFHLSPEERSILEGADDLLRTEIGHLAGDGGLRIAILSHRGVREFRLLISREVWDRCSQEIMRFSAVLHSELLRKDAVCCSAPEPRLVDDSLDKTYNGWWIFAWPLKVE